MRGRGLLLAFAFVVVGIVVAWLTGDKSPLADEPGDEPATERSSAD